MNERIKQLAEKSLQTINNITSEGVADRRTFNQLWFEHYNQNFAELIKTVRTMLSDDMAVEANIAFDQAIKIMEAYSDELDLANPN